MQSTTPSRKEFPLFQLSKFLDGKRDYQIVIRTDSFEELMEAAEQIKPLAEAVERKTLTAQPQPSGLKRLCKFHGTEMKSGISKKGKEYFFHDSPEGVRCFGKGYMDKEGNA